MAGSGHVQIDCGLKVLTVAATSDEVVVEDSMAEGMVCIGCGS